MTHKKDLDDLTPPGSTAALYFLPGQFVFKTFEQGREVTKLLLSEQVARAFHEYSADTGWLRHRVLRTLTGARGTLLVAAEPAGVRKVLCLTSEADKPVELTVPFPTLLLFAHQHDFFMLATKDKQPTSESRLYVAPCPNVGIGDHGRVCFGKNDPPVASPEALEAIWELFWASPFSHDHSAHKSRSAPEDVRILWQQLHDRRARTFPSAELIPILSAGKQVTVAGLWRQLAQNFNKTYDD